MGLKDMFKQITLNKYKIKSRLNRAKKIFKTNIKWKLQSDIKAIMYRKNTHSSIQPKQK